MMSYAEIRPPIDLAPWIASWWTFSVDESAGEIEHRIPLTGGAILSLARGGDAMIAGPRVTPLVTTVRGGERYWGIHFLPGAATAILGIPLDELRESVRPAAFWLEPGLAAALRDIPDDSFESWSSIFRTRTASAAPLHPMVRLAVALITHSRGAATIASIAQEAGVSPRALRRLFAEHVGLSPKELARVLRLRSAAADAVAGGESWIEVASARFSDQPHLVREFRSILGVTPGEFEQHARRIAHTLVSS